MNNKEEAEAAWHNKARQHASTIIGIPVNQILHDDTIYNGYMAYFSDFKAALIQAVEKEVDELGIPDCCDHVQFGQLDAYRNIIILINETKPLNK